MLIFLRPPNLRPPKRPFGRCLALKAHGASEALICLVLAGRLSFNIDVLWQRST
jgi:hypothetical protein